MKQLLERGANIEAFKSDGATALYIAAQEGHLEVVKLLLVKGANTRSTGATALYIASQNGHLEVVGLLLDKGANIEAALSVGETPLYISAHNGTFRGRGAAIGEGCKSVGWMHWWRNSGRCCSEAWT